jgi:hypothetical protein
MRADYFWAFRTGSGVITVIVALRGPVALGCTQRLLDGGEFRERVVTLGAESRGVGGEV